MEPVIFYGYLYYPGCSMAGIFYEGDDGTQGAIQWTDFNITRLHAPDPPGIICSSSRGLAVFRCSYVPGSLSYYISNPYYQLARTLLIPPPRHHNPDHTEVVLITDLPRNTFHIVCVCRFTPCAYRFDIYSSDTGWWESISEEMDYDILPNSGVSSGTSAYWLTSRTTIDKVFRLECRDGLSRFSLLNLPYDPSAEQGGGMQLGRAWDKLGLAIVSPALRRVDMYTLVQEVVFQREGFLSVDVRPGQHFSRDNIAVASLYSTETGLSIRCNAMPEVIRFESSKMEVPLVVDNQLVMWEQNYIYLNRARLRVFTGNAPPNNIVRGVPHVRTSLLPINFVENGNGTP